jgi:hypothetical protein
MSTSYAQALLVSYLEELWNNRMYQVSNHKSYDTTGRTQYLRKIFFYVENSNRKFSKKLNRRKYILAFGFVRLYFQKFSLWFTYILKVLVQHVEAPPFLVLLRHIYSRAGFSVQDCDKNDASACRNFLYRWVLVAATELYFLSFFRFGERTRQVGHFSNATQICFKKISVSGKNLCHF